MPSWCCPTAGRPDFRGLHRGWRSAGAQLAVFAFDLLYRDGKDLRALPLMERRRRLTRLLARSDVPCLYLVDTFEDGGAVAPVRSDRPGRHRVEASGRTLRVWHEQELAQDKTEAWRKANTER